MDILTSEQMRVKQQIEIEELNEEKVQLLNLIKEMKTYNNLSLEEKKKTKDKIQELENRIRKIENRINQMLYIKKKTILDKIKSFIEW